MIPTISAKSGLPDFTPVLVGRVVHPPHTHPTHCTGCTQAVAKLLGVRVTHDFNVRIREDVQKLKPFHFLNHVVVKVAILPGFEPGPPFLEDKHDDQNTTHAGLPTEICFLFLIGKE